jgi:SAM-dependent methyltransferase
MLGLARCKSCSVICTTGSSREEVAGTYTEQYYGSGSRKFLPIIERAISQASYLQAKKITRIWRRAQSANKAPTVLDIGCGRGNLLRAFQTMGASVLGLERAEFPEQDRPSDIVRVGSITDPEYADSMFDIIILWHVLEHLETPEKLLAILEKHLNENGLLVIAVPNYASLQQRMFSKYWFHLDLPRHLVHFESQWLLQRLSDRGFSIKYVSYVDPLQNVYGFIQSTLNAIAPRQLNEYYKVLKYGRARESRTIFPLVKWSVLSLIVLPFAILESILGQLLRAGATVQVAAMRGKTSDQ